jgi:hypothetical protein
LFLQANVNPKAELANDFAGKRKAVHIGSCKLMRDDLKEKAAVHEAMMKVIFSSSHYSDLGFYSDGSD